MELHYGRVVELSLTSFVKSPGISNHIVKKWPIPPFNLEAPLRAPPLTKNYSLMGTAFDYLLRFHLKQKHPEAIEKKWIAESAVDKVQARLAILEQDELKKPHFLGMHEFFKNGALELKTAKKEYAKFLKRCKLTEDLLNSIIQLARLDPYFRAGYMDRDLGSADSNDINDLKQLYELIPKKIFSGGTNVLLNPIFPFGSRLVGGADCDVILDREMIDFKTTKFLQLKKDYWVQLVGYAVLADLALTVKNDFPKLESFGIYFCRHGVTWNYPINSIYENSKYPRFREWFVQQAKLMFPQKS